MLHRLLADLEVENFQDEKDSVVTNYLNYGKTIRTIQQIVRNYSGYSNILMDWTELRYSVLVLVHFSGNEYIRY